jgi:O-antigen ligase
LITKDRLLPLIATAAVVLSPALILTVRGGTGYCYFLVLALSLYTLRAPENRRRALALYRTYPLYVAGMVALPCLVIFQLVVLRTGRLPALDPLLRLALVPISLAMLASLPSRYLQQIRWGFVAGALGVAVWAIYATIHPAAWTQPGRLGNTFTNPIPFGDTALLLAFMSVVPLARLGRPTLAEIAITALAFAGGCYASYLSGTRGNWIAIPILLWALASGRRHTAHIHARWILACVVLVCVVVLGTSHVVRERSLAFVTDIQQLDRGNSMTSTGMRLDLWRAALRLYQSNPIIGVGRGSLESALNALANRGEAPRPIVNPHAHNEFFSVLAEMGTLGVIALLLLYTGIISPFWRNRHDPDPGIATAAHLGLALGISTVLFGLTIDVLPTVMNTAFLALTSATLLAWIESRRRERAASQDPLRP